MKGKRLKRIKKEKERRDQGRSECKEESNYR